MPVKKVKSPSNSAGRQKSKVKTTTQNLKIEKKADVKTKKESSLITEVYDIKGKVVKKIELPKEIFGAKVNKQLTAQAVRVYLANQRRGTASTKTRGEVRGSTRKIYRQKGTGRARHGGIRAPIFVHGGIAFGPKPKDYSLKFPKKMKRQALFSALSQVYKNDGMRIIAGLEKVTPKTKSMVKVLDNLQLVSKKKNILFVLPEKFEEIERSARNIAGISLILATQLNTYEVLKNHMLLFMEGSIQTLEKHFTKREEHI